MLYNIIVITLRKERKKMKRIILCLAAAASSLLIIIFSSLTAFAASQEDVITAAREAGVSDFYINQGLKNEDDYTSEQYDQMLEQIKNYKDTVNIYLAKYFGGNPEIYSSSDEKRESDADFINMTMDEKTAYIYSLSDGERDRFIKTMTNSERNSVIKQLSANEITQILTPLIDFAKTLGFNVSIDSITGDGVSMSFRDEDGNLLDVTTVGAAIDDVGYSYTLTIFIPLLLIIISAAGIIIIASANRKRKEQ